MSRARRPKSPPVQLFPFLAVLVSTIGALVLLLLAINRQSTRQAIAQAVRSFLEQAGRQEESLLERRADLEQELDRLRAQLENRQSEERSLEASFRSRGLDIENDSAATRQTQRDLTELGGQRTEIEARIAEVRQRLLALASAKERLEAESKNPRPTFRPVVHPGTNGTMRQPIYLECTARGVILQPEGIVINRAALEQEMGREALEGAVRALSDFYLKRDLGPKQDKNSYRDLEPYPLLIVRPDGISSYHLARAALEPIGLPFGYELIASDWALNYPQPDPAARSVLLSILQGTASGPGSESDITGQWAGMSRGRPRGGSSLTSNIGGALGLLPHPPRDPTTLPGAPAAASRTGQADGSGQMRGGEREQHAPNPLLAGGPSPPGTWQRPLDTTEAGSAADSPTGSVQPDPEQDIELPQRPTRRGLPRNRDTSDRGEWPGRSSQSQLGEGGELQDRRLALPGNATAGGKVVVPRTIPVVCTATSLLVGKKRTVIPIPASGPRQETLERLLDEMEREKLSWGPTGMIFLWEPRLLCDVRGDGLEVFYWLQFAAAEYGIPVGHQIVAEDTLNWNESWFLRDTPTSVREIPPLWE